MPESLVFVRIRCKNLPGILKTSYSEPVEPIHTRETASWGRFRRVNFQLGEDTLQENWVFNGEYSLERIMWLEREGSCDGEKQSKPLGKVLTGVGWGAAWGGAGGGFLALGQRLGKGLCAQPLLWESISSLWEASGKLYLVCAPRIVSNCHVELPTFSTLRTNQKRFFHWAWVSGREWEQIKFIQK